MKSPWVVLFLALACGCSKESSPAPANKDNQEPASASSASPLSNTREDAGSDPPSAAPAAVGDAGASADAAGAASAVWTPFSRKDDIPLCVLANYQQWDKTQFLNEVKPKVSVKAGHELQFGTYAPGCAGLDCIRKVTMQCWIDVAGFTLTAHTRFSGEEVVGSTCTTNCEATTAACNTPALKAGTYTLTYGERQTTIRVPSVLHPACIDLASTEAGVP